MKKHSQCHTSSIAEEAARLMAEGVESEYLQAKERAMMKLGLSSQSRLPSNRKVRELVGKITKAELGEEEVSRRVRQMREIALEIMEIIEAFDPFLIGSTLSGEIRETSDVDLHAYTDDFEEIKFLLADWGYQDIFEEIVQNMKGKFIHLKWLERGYPVEITIYSWANRDIVPFSSTTGKAMKRADIAAVRRLLKESP